MMKAHTIFILGDSTSMSIGCERHMYPFILADSPCWPESTEIINCSQPGFTSADACAFFFRHWRMFPSLKAVVIYLGTCDSVSWETKKGKYSLARETLDRLKIACGLTKERTRLKNRLIPYEWNSAFDPGIESPEHPKDYEYNISRIIRACSCSSIPVALVRPKANPLFLPGLGKANFVFYRYLGINDRHANRVAIPDCLFLEALTLHESGDYSGALKKYRKILFNNNHRLTSEPEYPLLVVNNYAACSAEGGNLDEAELLLRLILKERSARKEIVLYNLAKICQMRGDEEGYQRLLNESYESDTSMYRVRAPYLEALDRVSDRFAPSVNIIDIASFIGNHLFVDHTHPLRAGQKLIAERIAVYLNSIGLRGCSSAEIQNVLYNPELSLGNTTEFYTYFRTYAPLGEEDILKHINRLMEGISQDLSAERKDALIRILPKELGVALNYHLTHPCFPDLRLLLPFGPRYPSDVGRFPEFFLIRHLIPYMRLLEQDANLQKEMTMHKGLLRTSKELLAALPQDVFPLVASGAPSFDSDIDGRRLPAILAACKYKLMAHLKQGNQIQERLKTTIYWYFREGLRYGAHSRISMRYDRTNLEYTAEGLAVALLINHRLGMDHGAIIAKLGQHLNKTVDIHEHYCERFSLSESLPGLLNEYDRKLVEIAEQLTDIQVG